ncbi:hypothetical protein BJY59DRAFT_118068 [Rhodotorula toruloides]
MRSGENRSKLLQHLVHPHPVHERAVPPHSIALARRLCPVHRPRRRPDLAHFSLAEAMERAQGVGWRDRCGEGGGTSRASRQAGRGEGPARGGMGGRGHARGGARAGTETEGGGEQGGLQAPRPRTRRRSQGLPGEPAPRRRHQSAWRPQSWEARGGREGRRRGRLRVWSARSRRQPRQQPSSNTLIEPSRSHSRRQRRRQCTRPSPPPPLRRRRQ